MSTNINPIYLLKQLSITNNATIVQMKRVQTKFNDIFLQLSDSAMA